MKFTDLRIGTPVTGLDHGRNRFDNFIVVAVGYNWAVLSRDGDIYQYILEPDDEFEIGYYEYNEDTGSLELVKLD